MVKLFMFSPVSGLYSCPLAMTDGATKTIQVRILNKSPFSNIHSFQSLRLPLSQAYNNLISRDPGEVSFMLANWTTLFK